MINTMQVYSWFCMLSGLDADNAAIWQPLCDGAAKTLEAKLKKDLDAEIHMERLCMTAAGIAYARYLSYRSGAAGDIRVGDISVKDSSPSRGEDYYISLVSDLTEPDGFMFMSAPEAAVREADNLG